MRFLNKSMLAMLLAMTVTGAAGAQDASPTPSPSPTPAPQASPASPSPSVPLKFYLEVSDTDLQSISVALQELPKKIADPLILKLNAQLQKQAEVAAARAEALKEPEKK